MVFGFGKRESKAMSKLPAAPAARERAQSAFVPEDRRSVFPAAMAKGGQEILDPKKTAILFIEYQNEFTTVKGKLHDGVKDVMGATGMLAKSVEVAKACRAVGAKVMHAAITFSEDASDNPNKSLGILKGCCDGKLFVRGTWGAEFCEDMSPMAGDIIVEGKRGLDAFPGTTLEAELRANKVENLVLAGFLTNCCVESTMRTAFEKGFNVITLTDCCATTSADGHKAATEGTFGMFSTPMSGADFTAKLEQGTKKVGISLLGRGLKLHPARSWDAAIAEGFATVSLDELLARKKVAIFGVPGGPFTGTCSAAHVPSWSGETLAALKAAGVEQVLCVCVASPYAMNAWAEKLAAEGIGFYTDHCGALSALLGLSLDGSAFGLPSNMSHRYSLLVDDGALTIVNVEAAPTDMKLSAGTYMLEQIEAAKPFHPMWPAYEEKMKAEGLSTAAIDAFKYNFKKLTSGDSLFLGEAEISPVAELPAYESLSKEDPKLLTSTVMLKLNGGLGTGMGLDKAKSLLPLKGKETFLDFIAQQVLYMRKKFECDLAFTLMNSFATSGDTISYLKKYKGLAAGSLPLEFVQNKAPKVTKADLTPAAWPKDKGHEWCPPGHGDLYPALLGSGMLTKLQADGFKYMFVSNSDNLGATMDLKLLTWFAQSGAPFAMEVAARTDADKKGGHLARSKKTGGLLLRESAQCPDADEKAFQNVTRHKFFNTNNLWINIEALQANFDKYGGALPLPVISNEKTVDPRDKKSTAVLQLETAMGAAIECFGGAQAILIPRSRFAPVKTTADMLALMSDAYEITDDFRMVLKAERNGVPPNVKLDGSYKFVDDMMGLVKDGPPSLINCTKLTVEGKMTFDKKVVFEGEVKVVNETGSTKRLKSGTYKDTTVTL